MPGRVTIWFEFGPVKVSACRSAAHDANVRERGFTKHNETSIAISTFNGSDSRFKKYLSQKGTPIESEAESRLIAQVVANSWLVR